VSPYSFSAVIGAVPNVHTFKSCRFCICGAGGASVYCVLCADGKNGNLVLPGQLVIGITES
jgi:hypothetical protein